jgi:hypothetical protein
MVHFIGKHEREAQAWLYEFKILKGGDKSLVGRGDQTNKFSSYLSEKGINQQFEITYDSQRNITTIIQHNPKTNDPTLSDFRYWVAPTNLEKSLDTFFKNSDINNSDDSKNKLIQTFYQLFEKGYMSGSNTLSISSFKTGIEIVKKFNDEDLMKIMPEIVEGVIGLFTKEHPNKPFRPVFSGELIEEPSSNCVKGYFRDIITGYKNYEILRNLLKNK